MYNRWSMLTRTRSRWSVFCESANPFSRVAVTRTVLQMFFITISFDSVEVKLIVYKSTSSTIFLKSSLVSVLGKLLNKLR